MLIFGMTSPALLSAKPARNWNQKKAPVVKALKKPAKAKPAAKKPAKAKPAKAAAKPAKAKPVKKAKPAKAAPAPKPEPAPAPAAEALPPNTILLDRCKVDGWESGKTYILNQDLPVTPEMLGPGGVCMEINGGFENVVLRNITLDCQNHSIIAAQPEGVPFSVGIHLLGKLETVVVKNCKVKLAKRGIVVENISETGSVFLRDNSVNKSEIGIALQDILKREGEVDGGRAKVELVRNSACDGNLDLVWVNSDSLNSEELAWLVRGSENRFSKSTIYNATFGFDNNFHGNCE